MPDKIGQGVIWEAPPSAEADARRIEADLEKLRVKRDAARWYIVAGFGLLFAGSFSVYFAMGGVVMAAYGVFGYMFWSRQMRRVEDPWKDADIDDWERENFG